MTPHQVLRAIFISVSYFSHSFEASAAAARTTTSLVTNTVVASSRGGTFQKANGLRADPQIGEINWLIISWMASPFNLVLAKAKANNLWLPI